MSIVEKGGPLVYGEPLDDNSSSRDSFFAYAPWNQLAPNTYECRVYLLPEEEGYSIWMADLPGVVSQGDTEVEAIENLKEAFLGALETYREEGMKLPWMSEPKEKPQNAMERWILVNA